MKWYEITNKSAEKAEIWIYEQIGQDFWTGDGVTAKNFQKELAEVKASQIDLHINSVGGEVFDGIAIYNLIKQHSASVTTYIDGIAASIASVIALAGEEIIMAENGLFMIHNPSGMVIGEAGDMRKMADTLDKVKGSLITAYMGKSGKSEEEITAMMDAETWFSADEAKEFGFVDSIGDKLDMAACAKLMPHMVKAKFRHIPEAIAQTKEPPTERQLEKLLRDSGFNQEQAKEIIAKGYQGLQRDADVIDITSAKGQGQRDADLVGQRDADQPRRAKDRVADILTRAEIAAPKRNSERRA